MNRPKMEVSKLGDPAAFFMISTETACYGSLTETLDPVTKVHTGDMFRSAPIVVIVPTPKLFVQKAGQKKYQKSRKACFFLHSSRVSFTNWLAMLSWLQFAGAGCLKIRTFLDTTFRQVFTELSVCSPCGYMEPVQRLPV